MNTHNAISDHQPSVEHKEKNFFQHHYKQLMIGFSAFLLIITLTVTGILVILRKDAEDTQSTATLSDSELKSMAAARFQKLTGISYDEYNQVTLAMEQTNMKHEASLESFNTRAQNTGNTEDSMTLAIEEIQNVEEKLKDIDAKGYYNEQEITIHNTSADHSEYGLLNNIPANHPKYDITKPYIIKSWTHPIYNKGTSTQGKEIISMTIYTPTFSLMYAGGNYAVKELFTEDRYYPVAQSSTYENPEISFIKSLLAVQNGIKKTGETEIDGQKLIIYEQNIPFFERSASTSSPLNDIAPVGKSSEETSPEKKVTMKYFIDPSNFSLVQTEAFRGNEKVQTTKIIKSEEYENSEKYMTYDELGSTEVKEIQRSEFIASELDTPTFKSFIEKYPVYQIEGAKSTVDNPSMYDDQQNSFDEWSKLVNTKDFDPTYQEVQQNSQPGAIASYSHEQVYFEIYKEKPEHLFSNTDEADQVKRSNIQIRIDGKNIPAELLELRYTGSLEIKEIDELQDTSEFERIGGNSYIMFQGLQGLWCVGNERIAEPQKSMMVGSNPIKLTSLTESEAEEIDQKRKAMKHAYPEIEEISLEKISSELRILPGDLSKDYNFTAFNVSSSKKNGAQSTCEQYLEVDISCLVEKYNGYIIYFSTKIPQNLPGEVATPDEPAFVVGAMPDTLEFVVLDAPPSITQPSIAKARTTYSKMPEYTLEFKEINRKTVILAGTLSKNQKLNILNNVSPDKDLISLQEQVTKSQSPLEGQGGGSNRKDRIEF